jgi:hypothetical protein
MRAGQSDYHEARGREVSVHLDDGTARLVGRIVTDAAGYGPRGRWPLQLTMDFVREEERSLAVRGGHYLVTRTTVACLEGCCRPPAATAPPAH